MTGLDFHEVGVRSEFGDEDQRSVRAWSEAFFEQVVRLSGCGFFRVVSGVGEAELDGEQGDGNDHEQAGLLRW